MKEHHSGRYSYTFLSGELFPHLLEVDEAAQSYLKNMIPRMTAVAGVVEKMKASDQMAWRPIGTQL